MAPPVVLRAQNESREQQFVAAILRRQSLQQLQTASGQSGDAVNTADSDSHRWSPLPPLGTPLSKRSHSSVGCASARSGWSVFVSASADGEDDQESIVIEDGEAQPSVRGSLHRLTQSQREQESPSDPRLVLGAER